MNTSRLLAFHPPRRALETALIQITERRKLFGNNAAGYNKLGTIESLSHELAHALELGADFEIQLDKMPSHLSNKHEASTLRIEVTALADLGVHISLRRLWSSANWNGMDDKAARPGIRQLRAPLSRHERRCVSHFVAMVAREIKLVRQHQS